MENGLLELGFKVEERSKVEVDGEYNYFRNV
jgi:hypothetical protein